MQDESPASAFLCICRTIKFRTFAYSYARRPLVHRVFSPSNVKWTKWTSKWTKENGHGISFFFIFAASNPDTIFIMYNLIEKIHEESDAISDLYGSDVGCLLR